MANNRLVHYACLVTQDDRNACVYAGASGTAGVAGHGGVVGSSAASTVAATGGHGSAPPGDNLDSWHGLQVSGLLLGAGCQIQVEHKTSDF